MVDNAGISDGQGSSGGIIYDFNPNNLPPDIQQAVGLLVAASAQTESIVQEFIGGLLRIDNIATRALTTQMSTLLKDQVARSLAELIAPSAEELDNVDDLLDQVFEGQQRRNQLVHNSLMRHPETDEVFSFREQARGSFKMTLQPITAAALRRDAELIYQAGMRLMEFMMLRGLLPSERTSPLWEQINRGRKARAERRELIKRSRGS